MGKINVTVSVDEDVHVLLKTAAALRGASMSELGLEAIVKFLETSDFQAEYAKRLNTYRENSKRVVPEYGLDGLTRDELRELSVDQFERRSQEQRDFEDHESERIANEGDDQYEHKMEARESFMDDLMDRHACDEITLQEVNQAVVDYDNGG